MAGEIFRLKPDQVVDLIKQGQMEVINHNPPPEPLAISNRKTEKGKLLFGENFLDQEAIHVMVQKCQAKGINVTFEIPQAGALDLNGLRTSLSPDVIEAIKADEAKDKKRLVVLRPEFMIVNGERKPVNLINFRSLFGTINPFGRGELFYGSPWYDSEDFARQPLRPGFGLPTRNVVRKTLNKTWTDQESTLEPGERRREAIEAVWDTILYYAATGKRLLQNTYDWTSSRASDGDLVSVGAFDSNGLDVGSWSPEDSGSDVGVCPSR